MINVTSVIERRIANFRSFPLKKWDMIYKPWVLMHQSAVKIDTPKLTIKQFINLYEILAQN